MEHRKHEVYSAEFKMSVIEEYQQSGMTIKAYAESIGVRAETFYVWLRKIRKADINKSHDKLIDISSLVKPSITSSLNHLSIKGVELDVDDNALLKIVRELRSW